MSTIQTNGDHHHFFIQIAILGHVLVHSVDLTHVLVVTAELIWFLLLNFVLSTLFQNQTNLLSSQDSEEAIKSVLPSV